MEPIKTSRIKIEDLPVYSDPSQEELDLVTGAGRARPSVEILEDRSLMTAGVAAGLSREGALAISGTEGNDQIIVRQFQDRIYVDGIEDKSWSVSDVNEILIDAGGGDDIVMLHSESVWYQQAINRPAVILGGAGNDSIVGTSAGDIIFGGTGIDTIFGNVGDDIILGGAGDDDIFGEGGNDLLLGDGYNDLFFTATETGNDRIWGGNGDDWIQGDDWREDVGGNDILVGDDDAGQVSADGEEPHEDMLDGGVGDNQLYLGTGDTDARADASSKLQGATLADWVRNAPNQTLVYKATIEGSVEGQQFTRTVTIVVKPTINLKTKNGVNRVDVHLYSGNPSGHPGIGAINLVTNSAFIKAGQQDVTNTTLKTNAEGRQILTIKPDKAYVSMNTPYNVFTKGNNLYFSPEFHVTGGVVSLSFTKGGKMSGTIELTGKAAFGTKYRTVKYTAKITGGHLQVPANATSGASAAGAQAASATTLSGYTAAPRSPAATTLAARVTIPASPTDLVASKVGSNLTLAWTDHAFTEKGFKIQISKDGITWSDKYAVAAKSGTGAASLTFSTKDYKSGTKYYFRVIALSGSDASLVSNVVSVQL